MPTETPKIKYPDAVEKEMQKEVDEHGKRYAARLDEWAASVGLKVEKKSAKE